MTWTTRDELEQSVPHEDHCDRYGIHQDCCPGRSDYGCTCLIGTVLNLWETRGWLNVAPPQVTLEDLS